MTLRDVERSSKVGIMLFDRKSVSLRLVLVTEILTKREDRKLSTLLQ